MEPLTLPPWYGTQCWVDGPKAEEYGSHDKTFEIPEDGKSKGHRPRWNRFNGA